MTIRGVTLIIGLGLALSLMTAHRTLAQSSELGDGFKDHGPAAPVSTNRGIVSVADADGRDMVLVWLYDTGNTYALLQIDAQTGETVEHAPPSTRCAPYASILATNGRYYTHFAGHFIEFDPLAGEISFTAETIPRSAMSMTEDDEGVIWSATYPSSGVASYDPATGEFRDFGSVHEHPSLQYPRSMAADDQGWIYIGIDLAAGRIAILDPSSGAVSFVVPEQELPVGGGFGTVRVQRDLNGRVYGSIGEQWYELHGGQAARLDDRPEINRKPIITGAQGLFHRNLPGGERVSRLDLAEGLLVIENPETGQTREVSFEYSGGGASPMGLVATADGTVAGGTYHPKRFFQYDPGADEWNRRPIYGQWNTVAALDDLIYVGSYSMGDLLEWRPTEEWVHTRRDDPETNPRIVHFSPEAKREAERPYTILAHPDGRHIIYGGMPEYGHTGGGLVIYDRETGAAEVIPHERVLQWHCPASLVALPDGNLVGGTSREPALGGVRRVEVAELFIMEFATREVVWSAPLLDGVARYTEMMVGPDGNVFGIADRRRFFVFDPQERVIVHEADLEEEFGLTASNQGPQVFVQAPDGRIFVLFSRGIAALNPETWEIEMLAQAPVAINNGGAVIDGRLYYATNRHIHSWALPPAE